MTLRRISAPTLRAKAVALLGVLVFLVSGGGLRASAQAHPCSPNSPGDACTVEASIANDYIVLHATPNSDVAFQVFDAPGGKSVYGPATARTNADGIATARLARGQPGPNGEPPPNVDLVPGNSIVMIDETTSTRKTLDLATLSIDRVDPDADIVSGHAPVGAAVTVRGSPGSLQATADSAGAWAVDFRTGLGYDVTSNDAFAAEVFDGDGDGTIHELGAPLIDCTASADVRCGSAGPDTIRFSQGDAFVGGNDDTVILSVSTSTGDVVIDSGTGSDFVVVSADQQAYLSSLGPEASAKDVLIDGRGSDSLAGFFPPRPGVLTVKMLGSKGIDLISSFFFKGLKPTSSPGGYRLIGRGGGDLMDTGDGKDFLSGGPGGDWLTGNDGDDILIGGRGDDVLDGGRGYDICYSEKGEVVFGCNKIIHKLHP